MLFFQVPATNEVLASIPNVLGALCLNTHGLEAFVKFKPFEKLFRVLKSPEYLPAMRSDHSADPIDDAATNFGNAMNQLMRQQKSVKKDVTAALIKVFFLFILYFNSKHVPS